MFPDESRAELLRAAGLREQGDLEEADLALAQLELRHPKWPQPALLRADVALDSGSETQIESALQRLLVHFPERPGALMKAERMIAARRPLAVRLGARLAGEHGRHPIVARLACEAALADHRLDDARRCALKGLTTEVITPAHVTLGQQLLQLGRREEVLAWIAAVQAADARFVSDRARETFSWFARRQSELTDPSGSLRIYRAADALGVLFVFGGLRNQPGIEEADLVAALAGLPVHVVAMRDPSLLMYLKGVPGVADSFETMAVALKRLARELGGGRILTFGTSAGGYTALRYGDAIDADAVLCDSGLTNMTEASMRADGRAGAVATRMLAEVRDQLVDMREVLARRERPLDIELWYGADMPLDRAYAERIADLPGVRLRPVPGHAAHGVIARVPEARGWLRDFVEAALRS